MIKFLKKFRKAEEGAVTVDWVVLTAAVVSLGVAAVSSASDGVATLGGNISTGLSTTTVDNGD